MPMREKAQIHLYNASGEYAASCVHFEDAAGFVALLGEGATVRIKARIVWREGHESQLASESYDFAANEMYLRTLPPKTDPHPKR
jgi:hypothetical protein